MVETLTPRERRRQLATAPATGKGRERARVSPSWAGEHGLAPAYAYCRTVALARLRYL